MPPWRETADGVELAVRVTPRGGPARIEGLTEDGALRLRVPAPPVEGAANAEVAALLAKALGVPKSDVILAAGGKARLKRFRIRGRDLAARLRALGLESADGPGESR